METENSNRISQRLIQYGVLLLLLGLITGLAIPGMKNARMGLSSHLEGTFNGMLLILFGIIWPRLELSGRLHGWGSGLALFGAYTNWFTTLLAGIWGAGSAMMPIAGAGMVGRDWQELIVRFGLISLSLAMVSVCLILLIGLRQSPLVTKEPA